MRTPGKTSNPRLNRIRRLPAWLALTTLLAAPEMALGQHVHTWTGVGNGTHWSVAGNWIGNLAPHDGSRSSTMWCQIQLGAWGNDATSVNDIVPPPGYSATSWHSLVLKRLSLNLQGNPIGVNYIRAMYAANTNSTLDVDIYPHIFDESEFSIGADTNNSELTILGDILFYDAYCFRPTNHMRVSGAGDVTIRGAIRYGGARPFSIAKEGSGELYLYGSGANSFQGPISVMDGMLRLNRYTIVGGSILMGTTAVPGDLSIGTGTAGPASDLVVLEKANQIANTSRVSIYGTGQLDLNDHSDTIESLTMTAGSVVTGNGTLSVISNVTVAPASGASIISGKLNLVSPYTNSALYHIHRFNVSNAAELRISATIGGEPNAVLQKWQGGELVLTGSNTYDHSTTIMGGTLTVAHPRALGRTNEGVSLHSAVLHVNGVAVTNETITMPINVTPRLTGTGTSGWWGEVELSSPLTVEAVSGATFTLGGVVSRSSYTNATSGFTKTGSGTLRLAGSRPNTFTNPCVVASGTLDLAKPSGQNAVPCDLTVGDGLGGVEADIVKLAADDQIANSSAVEVTASGLLNLNGNDETIRLLTGSGAVNLGSGNLTVSNDVDQVFAGTIRGGRAGEKATLTKTGRRTWTLSSSNVQYHATIIKNGTLLVNGSLTRSPVAIEARGRLGGTGTVQGVSFSGSGGVLSPGASTGKLLAQGTVVMEGGTLEVELNGLTPGTGYDQLVTEVAPTLAKGSLSVACGFAPPAGSTFMIISNRSALPVTNAFMGKAQGTTFGAGGALFQISYTGGDGNDVVLTCVQGPAVSNFVATVSGGQLQLQAQGVPGASYILQATPHLNAPIPWQPIRTNVASVAGLIQFTDADLLVNPQRFYRLASP